MSEAMHPYENLKMTPVGIVAGLFLVGFHLWLWLRKEQAQAFLAKFPRNSNLGAYLMGAGLIWFWLLIAPEVRGSFSFLGKLSMDLGEFNGAKKFLQILVPLVCVGLILYVREFLAIRGLGVLALMAAAPMLEAAFLKEPDTRIFLSLYAYALLTKGMFCIGMPYLFRDAVTWATSSALRWKVLSLAGLAYGLLVLILSLMAWRGF